MSLTRAVMTRAVVSRAVIAVCLPAFLPACLALCVTGCRTKPGAGSTVTDDTGAGASTGPPPTDDDGDGFYTPEDCNDYDDEINPGATEVCDGLDNDCNGIVDVSDAVDSQVFYKDGDGDGYGDPDGEIYACSQLPGFVSEGTDCADDDPSTNPGAPEICSDGADNNCNGDDLECALTGELALSDADGIWAGEAGGDGAGFALAAAGDVNGDGLADLLVGAPNHDVSGNSDAGAAYLLLGPATGALDDKGLPVAGSLASAAAVWQGTTRSDDAGISLAGVGDVDGDGFADLLVGAYRSDLGGTDGGAAYLVHGPTTGSHLLAEADAVFLGELSNDYAGLGVAGGQDLTGDGILDLVVGASGQGDSSVQSRGRAYVIAGPSSGTVDLSSAAVMIDGVDSYDRVSRVALLPDSTGDGLPDLALGAYTWPDNDGNGAVFVFAGPLSGALTIDDATASLEGQAGGDQAGFALSTAGDVNGDGYSDLLVGAPEADTDVSEGGVAYLVFGPPDSGSLGDADVRFEGDEARENLGYAVAGGLQGGAGDFDHDGFDDVLLGAPAADSNGTDAGGAWLFYAPTAGTLTPADADLALVAEAARDAAGTAVAFIGNVNGDCCVDIAVGAVDADRGGSGSGVISLILGQGL